MLASAETIANFLAAASKELHTAHVAWILLLLLLILRLFCREISVGNQRSTQYARFQLQMKIDSKNTYLLLLLLLLLVVVVCSRLTLLSCVAPPRTITSVL